MFNTLLQLLDDGRLTDSQGRTVDFRNTIVIMTSNIGSYKMLDGINPDGSFASDVYTEVMGELRQHFKPEFLNRVDETVLFKPLLPEQIGQIIDLQLRRLQKRLEERKITLELTEPPTSSSGMPPMIRTMGPARSSGTCSPTSKRRSPSSSSAAGARRSAGGHRCRRRRFDLRREVGRYRTVIAIRFGKGRKAEALSALF